MILMTKYFSVAVLLTAAANAQVRYEDILKGPGDNWLTYAVNIRDGATAR